MPMKKLLPYLALMPLASILVFILWEFCAHSLALVAATVLAVVSTIGSILLAAWAVCKLTGR